MIHYHFTDTTVTPTGKGREYEEILFRWLTANDLASNGFPVGDEEDSPEAALLRDGYEILGSCFVHHGEWWIGVRGNETIAACDYYGPWAIALQPR